MNGRCITMVLLRIPTLSLCALLAAASGCDDGGGTGGSGGAAATDCPGTQPAHGDVCDAELSCVYEESFGDCASKRPVEANCAGSGAWHLQQPVTCEPLPAGAACDPLGDWQVTESGPFDPADALAEGYAGPFEVHLAVGENGLVYLERYGGKLSADGCLLEGWALIHEHCSEMYGESWCSYIDRRFTLDFSKTPAEGTVTLTCTGECGFEATAPVQATRQP